MTRITGTVVDISDRPADGILTVSAPALRHSADGKVVDRIRVDIGISNGAIATHSLDPGPAKLVLDTGGGWQEFEVVIPDVATIDMYDLVSQYVAYDPPVVSEVAELVRRAEEAADRAEQGGGTGGGGGIFLDADGVPYFDTSATGGGSIALDVDGVPYVTGV